MESSEDKLFFYSLGGLLLILIMLVIAIPFVRGETAQSDPLHQPSGIESRLKEDFLFFKPIF